MFGHKHMKHIWISLLAAMLVFTLLPLSALAVMENVLETAPEVTPTTMGIIEEIQTTEEIQPVKEVQTQPAKDAEVSSSRQYEEEYSSYMPYKLYCPERGTTPEEHQYTSPRMSDGELARYNELYEQLSNGSMTLEDVPSCVNKRDIDDSSVGVYPLDPEDFAGETYFVILPYDRKMDDRQILSLIASFAELGISFDPDSLNERNCTRTAYSGCSRFLTQEEQSRRTALQDLIARGLLTKENISPKSACFYTDPLYGDEPYFCIYPYRSMSDDELAAFLLADHSAWEIDPSIVRQLAKQQLNAVIPLPNDLFVTDSKVTKEQNVWPVLFGRNVNQYKLVFDTSPITNPFDSVVTEGLFDVTIWMLGESGKNPRIQEACIRYRVTYTSDGFFNGDNSEACLAAAREWARTKLALPEDQRPDNWTISEKNSGALYVRADTADWTFTLNIDEKSAQISVCDIGAKEFHEVDLTHYAHFKEDNSQADTEAANTTDTDASGLVAANDSDTDIALSYADSPYLPYEQYFPARGTTPDNEQYKLPRMSDSELARYTELLEQVESGTLSLEGIPTCVNRKDMDDSAVGVYPVNPKDFAGETVYVILPYNEKMDDERILSLIASFKELGITFDPDSLNERNCTRMAYNGVTRFLTEEEEARRATLQSMISRGILTAKDIAPESACFYTNPISGFTPFCFYPYRSLNNDELAAFLLADHSAWDSDPNLVERIAKLEASSVFLLPENMSVIDSKVSTEINTWAALSGDTVNRYQLFFESPEGTHYENIVTGEVSGIMIWLLEESGKAPQVEGYCLRQWVSIPENDTFDGDNSEACLTAAREWTRTKLALPEGRRPDNWKVDYRDSDMLYLSADTADWEFSLCINEKYVQIAICSAMAKKYLEQDYSRLSYNDSSDSSGTESTVLPDDTQPAAAESELSEAKHEESLTPEETGSPWLTDAELTLVKNLAAAMDDGKIFYGYHSVVNIPYTNEGAAVYPLNPEDFDGESFYVFLPDGRPMDELEIIAMLSAFKELGIPFDPDSLTSRNCCRNSSVLQTRSLSDDEQTRMNALRDRIISGEITRQDIAGVSVQVAEKAASQSLETDTKLFRFYPYREMTDDELAAFLFAEQDE